MTYNQIKTYIHYTLGTMKLALPLSAPPEAPSSARLVTVWAAGVPHPEPAWSKTEGQISNEANVLLLLIIH